MIRVLAIIAAVASACATGQKRIDDTIIQIYPVETASSTSPTQADGTTLYSGTVYVSCSAAIYYELATAGTPVTVDANDTALAAGVNAVTFANQSFSFVAQSGSASCDWSYNYQENVTITVDTAGVASSDRTTHSYTGDVEIICTRQTHHKLGDGTVTAIDTADPFSVAVQSYRTSLSSQRIAFWSAQSSPACSILGIKW